MTLPKILLILALVLILPSLAFATSIIGVDFGGTFINSQPPGGISLTGATFAAVIPSGFPLGSLTFLLPNPTTNVLGVKTWTTNTVGSLTFHAGALSFTGSFDCAVEACIYTPGSLSNFFGDFSGVLKIGSTTETILGNFTQNFKSGKGTIGSITAVPEIGTLSMVGMGLLGIAGFTKKKFSVIAGKLRILGHV